MYGASWPINEEISRTRPYDHSRELLPMTGHTETERDAMVGRGVRTETTSACGRVMLRERNGFLGVVEGL